MPVIKIYYYPEFFPSGREGRLMTEITDEIGRHYANALLSWTQQDLGQGRYQSPSFHLEVNWPFSGPKELQVMVGNIGAVTANFMNINAPKIAHIEIHVRRDCLRFDRDGYLVLGRTIDCSQPGEKLFPVRLTR